MENPHEIGSGLWCRWQQIKAHEKANKEYLDYLNDLINPRSMKDVTPTTKTIDHEDSSVD